MRAEEPPRIAGIMDAVDAAKAALRWYRAARRKDRWRVMPAGWVVPPVDIRILEVPLPSLDVYRRPDESEYMVASSDPEYVVEGAGPVAWAPPRIAEFSYASDAAEAALRWYRTQRDEDRGRVVPLPAHGSESREEDEHLLGTPELDVWRRLDGSEYMIALSDPEYVVEGAGPLSKDEPGGNKR